MGRDIQAIKISGEDRRKYRDKVRRSLDVFARMLRERLFDENPSTVGQEIELNLVDERGMPSMRNADVLAAIADPAWATEVGQFNLEINVPPRHLDGDALGLLEADLRAALNAADAKARSVGCHLVMVGVLAPRGAKGACRRGPGAQTRGSGGQKDNFAPPRGRKRRGRRPAPKRWRPNRK